MFDNIKKNLYLAKINVEFERGIKNGTIVPFDDEFYEKLNHTYIFCLPISFHIKYLKPTVSPGKCYDRSLYMFLCFDNAILVRGDKKNLELLYGKDDAGHGWIEIDNHVYDPSYLCRFDKDLYYKMFNVREVVKTTKEEYLKDDICKNFYEEIQDTKLEDYKPYGRRRTELLMTMPLTIGVAKASGNQEFINNLNRFLDLIEYDEQEVINEVNEKIEKHIKQKKNV